MSPAITTDLIDARRPSRRGARVVHTQVPVGTLRRTTRRAVDDGELSTESPACHFRPGDDGGSRCEDDFPPYAGRTRGCAQSTALITVITSLYEHVGTTTLGDGRFVGACPEARKADL